MASSAQVALVANTPTVLTSNPQHEDTPMSVLVNNAGATAVQLGGSAVSGTTGYNLAAGATANLLLVSGDSLYGFSTTATTVSVLTSP